MFSDLSTNMVRKSGLFLILYIYNIELSKTLKTYVIIVTHYIYYTLWVNIFGTPTIGLDQFSNQSHYNSCVIFRHYNMSLHFCL